MARAGARREVAAMEEVALMTTMTMAREEAVVASGHAPVARAAKATRLLRPRPLTRKRRRRKRRRKRPRRRPQLEVPSSGTMMTGLD